MFPFQLPEEQPVTKLSLIAQCIESLEDSDAKLMYIAETISKNADSIRNALDELVKQPDEQEVKKSSTMAEKAMDQMKGTIPVHPSPKPGFHMIELDPNDPKAFDVLGKILDNLAKGGHGHDK